jgi:hypothetical protein
MRRRRNKMGSVLVTPAKLISELIITHLKLWHTLEIAYDENASLEEVGKAKRKICQLNTRRTQLENEIDENFHEWLKGNDLYPFSPTLKDYKKH